ncbi:MAG: hypothetical protein Q4C96_09320 [Planctomycetia bacterium]|nr:hypothetical protein [Planctomycetia bacterium]
MFVKMSYHGAVFLKVLLLVMGIALPVQAATISSSFNQATAYYSQNDWSVANAINGIDSNGWGQYAYNQVLSDAAQMGTNSSWITNYGYEVSNIAVFQLADAVTVGEDNCLWINLDYMAIVNHAANKIRLYVTDVNVDSFCDGDANAYNSKTNETFITNKLGSLDIWKPLENYYSAKTRNGTELSLTGSVVRNETGPNGTLEAYYLYVPLPEEMSFVTGLKMELLLEEGGRGPGTHPTGFANTVLSDVNLGVSSVATAKSTAVGYSTAVNPIDAIQTGDLDTPAFIDPTRDRGGFGYDFGGHWTVNEVSFNQILNWDSTDRNAITSVDVYTSAGKFTFADLTLGDEGKVSLDLGGIKTSYVFISPTGQASGATDNRLGIVNLDVSTSGDFTAWENVALGKTVTLSGTSYVPDGSENALTDGVLGVRCEMSGSGGSADYAFNYLDYRISAGPSYIQLDLEAETLVNTIGIWQNHLRGRKILEEMRLEFSNDPNFANTEEIISYDLIVDPSMYQQIEFEDTLARYMRLIPTAYNQTTDWWGLGELQLFYNAPDTENVPEPQSWVLLLTAIFGMVCYYRKRMVK